MAATTVDLVSLVESMYRFDLPEDDWLRDVGAHLGAVLDPDHLGHMALTFRSNDPMAFAPTRLLQFGVKDSHWQAFLESTASLPAEYVAEGILNRSWSFMGDIPGWDAISGVRDGVARALGIADILSIGAVDANGRGCRFGAFQGQRRSTGLALRLVLGSIASHLAAVNRIRGRIEDGVPLDAQAEGIMDDRGRLVHASGDLREAAPAAELGRAARAMDSARAHRGRNDGFSALRQWPAFSRGRWTLVETFERDGRRFLLAVAAPSLPAVERLSERETQVVGLALEGLSNKAIAYQLGLAASTVRVLMTRAMAKVGARSREDLLRVVGGARHRSTM